MPLTNDSYKYVAPPGLWPVSATRPQDAPDVLLYQVLRCIQLGNGYVVPMITKTAAANGLTKQEASWLTAIDDYLAEMTLIRKRMKSTDQRVRRADASIRRSLDETWAILRHVQASR